MGLSSRANEALLHNGNTVNGATADIAITTHGSDWYWVRSSKNITYIEHADQEQTVCAIMTVATMAFFGLSFGKPRSHRIFHYITASITMVAAIAYFTMGSNLGFTPVEVEFMRSNPRVHGTYRSMFYVRYIDW